MINQKATVVLLRWKRKNELSEIITHLKSFPHLIDEIIVWDNRKANMCGYGRYLGALQAKNNVIYTQDDDVIVNNIPELFNAYDGSCIINNMKIAHLKIYKHINHTLPGWGMIFDKSWVTVLNKYILQYGIDDIFLRDTGRIFTGLVGKWKSLEADIVEFPSASDKNIALWKEQIHKERRDIAIERIDECKKQKNKLYNYYKVK